MGKRKTVKLDSSWIDIGEDEEASEPLKASSRSYGPSVASSRKRFSSKSIPELLQPQSGTLWASDFIMPSPNMKSPAGLEPPSPRRVQESRKLSRQSKRRTSTAETPVSDEPYKYARNVGSSIITWLISVAGQALAFLKKPLGGILAIWILIGLLNISLNALTSNVSTALTAVCRIPGVSRVASLCDSPVDLKFDGEHTPQPEFDRLMNIQIKFEELLEQTSKDYAIPAYMQQSQVAMRDVREVVKYSQLRSRKELEIEFNRFIDGASQASYDLELFNSGVSRTVDRVLLAARWTKRELDKVAGPNITYSAVGNLLNSLLSPFQPIRFSEDHILDQYIKHADTVQSEINDLLAKARAIFRLLTMLEELLDDIYGIAIRDTQYAKASRDEILALLWTKLGGNSKQVRKFETDLDILKRITTYGQAAYVQISGAIIKLQGMSAEVEQLRERLSGVDPIPGRPQIPLSLHMEHIEMGVQRLEEASWNVRNRKYEQNRKVLDNAERLWGDNGNLLPGT